MDSLADNLEIFEDKPTKSQVKNESTSSTQSLRSDWWGIFNAVKQTITELPQRSEKVIQTYTREVKEFANIIQTDTSKALSTLSNNVVATTEATSVSDLGKKVQTGITNIFGQLGQFVSDVAQLEYSEDPKESLSPKIGMTRQQFQIYNLQKNISTYLTEPEDVTQYKEWCTKKFDSKALENKTEEIASLLKGVKEIQEIYSQLVPEKVPYYDFWSRYYYRYYLLEQEEQKRAQLVKAVNTTTTVDETLPSWDEEEASKIAEPTPDSNQVSVGNATTITTIPPVSTTAPVSTTTPSTETVAKEVIASAPGVANKNTDSKKEDEITGDWEIVDHKSEKKVRKSQEKKSN